MRHRNSFGDPIEAFLRCARKCGANQWDRTRVALRAAFSAMILSGLILSSYPQCAAGQDAPQLRQVDRVRLAEAFRLADELQEKIWHGWSKAPFALLLVTPDYEFLMRHPDPGPRFSRAGYDDLLKSDVYFRKREFPTGFLATFPAVDGIFTIVVGQAENTMVKTSTPWIVTLLHEHLHQWQDSDPPETAQVKALDLAGGDETGMWMLNYPFSYDSPAVQEKFAAMSKLMGEALTGRDEKEFRKKFETYRKLRDDFGRSLSPKDYRYISFELWKEGIARYTEVRVAELAAASFEPSKAFRELPDFTPFEQTAQHLRERIFADLAAPALGTAKRESFYSFGAAEAMMLDRAKRPWQRLYFTEKFYLDKYF